MQLRGARAEGGLEREEGGEGVVGGELEGLAAAGGRCGAAGHGEGFGRANGRAGGLAGRGNEGAGICGCRIEARGGGELRRRL